MKHPRWYINHYGGVWLEKFKANRSMRLDYGMRLIGSTSLVNGTSA